MYTTHKVMKNPFVKNTKMFIINVKLKNRWRPFVQGERKNNLLGDDLILAGIPHVNNLQCNENSVSEKYKDAHYQRTTQNLMASICPIENVVK